MSKKKIAGIIIGGFFGLVFAGLVVIILAVSVVEYSAQSNQYNEWCAYGFNQLFIYNGDVYPVEMLQEKCFTNFESWKHLANTARGSQYLESQGVTLEQMIQKNQEMEGTLP